MPFKKGTIKTKIMRRLLLILIALPMIGFGQNVNIPDANFKAYLVGNTLINTNGDTEIQVGEATAFSGSISINSATLIIADLTGIEAFTALTQLSVLENSLTSLDVSQNTALTSLGCYDNNLTSLDVSQNTNLTYLHCSFNQLTNLDISNNTALTYLDCAGNQLTNLDVSSNTALTELHCQKNLLSILDVSSNLALIELNCFINFLSSLDVSHNNNLTYLECSDNQLTCIDVSNNTVLTELNCFNNLLTQLDTKNGFWASGMNVYANNNNLTCVEVDNLGYANTNWATTFDSFVTFSTNCNYTNPCATVSAIQEHTRNKELLKVTDLLGRETKQTNQPLLYLYDDGTVEKRIDIE